MNADSDIPASIPEDRVDLIVEVFRMLADPTRIRVLVVDAVYNAEHTRPEVPRHHRSDDTVRGIAGDRRPRKAAQR